MAFHLYEFFHGISNHGILQIIFHNICIHKVFHLCEVFHELSNVTAEQNTYYTAYSQMVFLLCEFSNAVSKYMTEQIFFCKFCTHEVLILNDSRYVFSDSALWTKRTFKFWSLKEFFAWLISFMNLQSRFVRKTFVAFIVLVWFFFSPKARSERSRPQARRPPRERQRGPEGAELTEQS